jgi:hypothetical protein
MAYAIKKGSDYFNTVTYTGTDEIHNITGVGFQPDFTIVKSRSNVASHNVYDAVRGIKEILITNGTDAELTEPANAGLDSFDSDGFTIDAVENFADVNILGRTYVAWNWKAGGTAVTNTDGDITTTVSANPTAGFSIVTFTGTGVITDTIGHGLGTTPEMMFLRGRSVGSGWYTYNKTMGNGKFMYLNTTQAETTSSGVWNNTSPTPTVFVTGGAGAGVTMVAYCFASVEGYSKIGSYTGNGSADGPFVYTGFRPKFLMFKTTTIIGHWVIVDAERNTYNVIDDSLYPDTTGSEINTITDVDFLSNGFKWRGVLSNETNVNGQVYIYMAFAETPFKFANAR